MAGGERVSCSAAKMNGEEKETFTIPLPLLLTFAGNLGRIGAWVSFTWAIGGR